MHFVIGQVVGQLAPDTASVLLRMHYQLSPWTVISNLSCVHTSVWPTILIFGFTEQKNYIFKLAGLMSFLRFQGNDFSLPNRNKIIKELMSPAIATYIP